MPDYSKCIIYKLCCKDLNIKEIYVGSTCNFTKRKWGHKTRFYSENNYKVYQFMKENGGFENWDMILVEEYPCENKMQKLQRERYWCEELKPSLNRNLPGRSKKEWSETHKEYYKEWSETHKEELKEYRKEYYETNKEYLSEKNKNWREENKDQKKIMDKKNYEKNKEQISEKGKLRVTCECGKELTKVNLTRHKKSKKHLDFINKN